MIPRYPEWVTRLVEGQSHRRVSERGELETSKYPQEEKIRMIA